MLLSSQCGHCIVSALVWLPANKQFLSFFTNLSRLQRQGNPLLPKALGDFTNDKQEQQPSGDSEDRPETSGDSGDQPEVPGDVEIQQQACGNSEDLQRTSGDDEDEQHRRWDDQDQQDQQQPSVAAESSIDVREQAALYGYGTSVQTRQLSGPGSFLSRGSSLRSGDFAALLQPGQIPSRTSLGGTTSCSESYGWRVCFRPMQTCSLSALFFAKLRLGRIAQKRLMVVWRENTP